MIEQDTIRLLKECDAGVDMGVAAIEDCLSYVKDKDFKNLLEKSKDDHIIFKKELDGLLNKYKDDGKDLHPLIKGMSKMKTNMKLSMDSSDSMVASVMTDGCDMGVKSLSKYLNEYKAADEKSKDLTKRIIENEEKLALDIRKYL